MWSLAKDLAALDERHLLRVRKRVEGAQGAEIEVDGRSVLCLASNNYLGLASHPRVIEASRRALEGAGASASASPLISGHMEPHERLERELADWLGCEAALLFGSGYHANIGVIAALVGEGDAVFSDALNHASLIDGCRLARAEVSIFRHCDLDHLEEQLRSTQARRKLIVSDSVFSMDGDLAPLAGLVRVAGRYDAWLMVDEAHAMGVFGQGGAGLVSACGLSDQVPVRMGTLGKALGSYGAFVAGSRSLVDLLLNRARSYVFSTGLPPAVVGAATEAIAMVRGQPEHQRRLWENARRLHTGLSKTGQVLSKLESTIVPLVLGDSKRTLAVARRALHDGLWAPAIRPPTVAEGTSRLRLTPMATHEEGQIDRAVEILTRAIAQEGE